MDTTPCWRCGIPYASVRQACPNCGAAAADQSAERVVASCVRNTSRGLFRGAVLLAVCSSSGAAVGGTGQLYFGVLGLLALGWLAGSWALFGPAHPWPKARPKEVQGLACLGCIVAAAGVGALLAGSPWSAEGALWGALFGAIAGACCAAYAVWRALHRGA